MFSIPFDPFLKNPSRDFATVVISCFLPHFYPSCLSGDPADVWVIAFRRGFFVIPPGSLPDGEYQLKE